MTALLHIIQNVAMQSLVDYHAAELILVRLQCQILCSTENDSIFMVYMWTEQ